MALISMIIYIYILYTRLIYIYITRTLGCGLFGDDQDMVWDGLGVSENGRI